MVFEPGGRYKEDGDMTAQARDHGMLTRILGRRAGLAAPLLLLAACAVGPDFAKPEAPAARNYTAGGPPTLANPAGKEAQQRFAIGQGVAKEWWTLFHSPDLDALVRRAIANNQNVAVARATLAQARDAAAQARGGEYPQAGFGANVSRLKTSLLPEGINALGPVANDFAVGPSVTYLLDVFGGQQRLIEQKDALAEVQTYLLDGAYLAISGNVVRDAIDIAAVHAELDALDALVREDEQTVAMVGKQFELHYKTRADLESARSQLAADRALLPPLRQRLAVLRDALAILAGQAPGEATLPDFRLEAFALPETLPVTVPSELMRKRPDLRAAEARLHAASAAIGIATSQLYPNITLSANITQESLQTSSLFTNGAMGWVVAAGLVAPLFDGGALEAQKRGAVDAYQAAYATYRQTVLESFGQVADVLQALQHDAELLEAEQAAVDAAGSALDAAQGSYAVARASIVQVLDAQRQLGRARIGYIRARAQRYLDTAQLFDAMGGGWLN